MEQDKAGRLGADAGHTPLPWSVGHRHERNYLYGDGAHIACIASRENDFPIHDDGTLNESEANAAFIVRACNSHYELLSALELACHKLRIAIGVIEASGTIWMGQSIAEDALTQADAALAKTRGAA